MKLRHWFAFSAGLTFIFGLASLLTPAWVGAVYGNATGADAALWAQYYGSAVLCISFITWFVRNLPDPKLQRMMALLLCLFYAINLMVSLRAQVAGVVNMLGWTNIILQVSLVLGFGYFVFVKSRTELTPTGWG